MSEPPPTQDSSTHAIAVIGMGGRFPGAPDLTALWRTVRAGRVHTSAIPRSRWNHDLYYSAARGAKDAAKTYANRFGLVDDIERFAPEFFGLTPRRAKVMDPQQRLLLDAVRAALEHAGYAVRPFDRARTGVFIGTAVSDFRSVLVARTKAAQLFDGQYGAPLALPEDDAVARVARIDELTRALTGGLAPLQAYSLVGQAMNMVAANVNQVFELGGPAFTTDSACSSALVALHEAVLHLRTGLCNLAIAGGVHAILSPDGVIAFTRIGAISPSNVCRPFDRRADGFVMGEGAGVVLLKRLPDALRDGDRVYAIIRGVAMNNDGKAEGPMTPRLEGQVAVLERAYADAGVSPQSVDYIEAHGTATPVGDATEVAALAEVRGAGGPPCALASIKANVGHCMTASGAAGLFRAVLSLDHRWLAPHAACEEPRPDLELTARGFHLPDRGQPWAGPAQHPRRAGLNSFGFGGTNVHVVLEEAPPPSARAPVRRQVPAGTPSEAPAALPELFVLSAPTAALLRAQAEALAEWLRAQPELSCVEIARTLSTRSTQAVRAAFVARDRAAAIDALAALAAERPHPGMHGPVDGAGQPPAPIAFLFPGQGAQAPGLARDLHDRLPLFRRALDELCAAVDATNGSESEKRPLLSYLYPEGADAAPDAAMAALTRTEVCQPIMAALGLAFARTCRELGVEPLAVAGHSLGEFAAAAHAGLFSARTAMRLLAARGQMIASLPLQDGGAMAALAAGRDQAEELVRGVPDVVIANVNHPGQVVLSGTGAAVDAALARAEAAGVKGKRLPVSHAFHSPLMNGLRARFAPLVEGTPFGPTDITLVSAIVPGPYPREAEAARAILTAHATAPVDFVGALRALAALGVRTFVQMGAGGALATMARRTLQTELPGATFLTVGADRPDDGATLLEALASLFVRGAALRLAPLFEGRDVPLATLPTSLLETRPLWPVKLDDPPGPRVRLALDSDGSSTPISAPAHATAEAPTMRDSAPLHPHAALTEAPGSPGAHSAPGATGGLAEVFARQLALLEGQLAIVREQNRLLAGAGVPVPAALARAAGSGAPTTAAAPPSLALPPEVTPAAPATSPPAPAAPPSAAVSVAAPTPAAGDTDVFAQVEARVIEAATRITAAPPGRITAATRLAADLGFDSLMVAELVAAMADAYPGLELPRALFADDLSITQLATAIANRLPAAMSATGVAAASDGTPADFVRRPMVLQPAPLATPAAPVVGRVLLLAGQATALAEAVAARLRADGVTVDAVPFGGTLAPASRDFAHVVDLRGLDPGPGFAELLAGHDAPAGGPGALLAPALRALSTLQELRAARPMSYLLFHDGAAALALEGMAKAVAAEWPSVAARSIELPGAAAGAQGTDDLAALVARELHGEDASPEIRYRPDPAGGGWLRTRPQPGPTLAAPSSDVPAVLRDAVVVISGGAGGLGGQLARALGGAGARVALLGRRAPDARTQALTRAIEQAGARALYLPCDVTDRAAVARALVEARATLGPVRFAIHAAGVTADAPIEEKTPESFARVFDTKVTGALNLWAALAGDPLEVFLSLGSLAGRAGNAHQLDYASANNTLARLPERFAHARPEVSSLTIALPPWADSPMVQALPEPVRRGLAARVGLLPGEEGVAQVLATLAEAAPRSGGRPQSGELVLARAGQSDTGTAGPGAILQRTLRVDARALPYLDDHVVAGRRVLPLAGALDLALRALARDAGATVRELTVVDGVVLPGADDSAVLAVRARAAANGARAFELVRHGPSGPRTAFRGLLAPASAPAALAVPAGGRAPALSLPEFYAERTFHGPGLQAVTAVREVGPVHISGNVRARPVAGGSPLVTALDGLLQLCALWATERLGKGGLPLAIDAVHLARWPGPDETLEALAVLDGDGGGLRGDAELRDAQGQLVLTLRGLSAELRELGRARAAGAKSDAAPAPAPAPPPRGTTAPAPSAPSTASTAPPALELPAAHVRPEEFPELKELEQRLALAKAAGIANPYFREHDGCNAATASVKGRELINFSSYNYLGLSGHPEVNAAVKAAVDRYGSSVSASRVASGQRPLHGELERALAELVGAEDSLVMVGGHATNVSGIGHLLGPQDLLVHDALAHDSILGGARLSGARRRPFAHNDPDALERVLRETRAGVRRVLIAVEGVYSMDGDIAPLPEIIALKKKYGALLLVDEAHSLGVLGAHGRGVGEHHGVDPADVDLWMGTLSKSLASCGGYLAGSRRLVQYLRYTVPGFVYSVGLSPANAAAALEAVRILRREPERARLLQARAALFLRLCRERGLDTGPSHDSAVVPCIVGNSYLCLRLSQALEGRGINVQPILYPAVEENQARLRFFISVTHTEAQLHQTADILAEELAALRPAGPTPTAGAPARPPSAAGAQPATAVSAKAR